MQRLTPDNPRVVWESEPVCKDRDGFDVFGLIDDDLVALRLNACGGALARAVDFPPRTRIRITAEVIEPEKEDAK